jgi:pSer/pThr/pTyr-binding forkhead associated (FHA) protein
VIELAVDNGRVPANPPADARSVSELKARGDAERGGRPFLLYRDAGGRQQLFFLEPGSASASVGRRAPADLLLDWDDRVSRLHAKLERTEGDWEVVDDGLSSNGTFVNAERLSGRRRLTDGDTLRFGSTEVTFRAPGREQLGTASPGASPAAVRLSTSQRRVLVALCRPYKDRRGFASPATDQQIADELVLSIAAVKTQLSVLCAKLGIERLSGIETRVRLVERAFSAGLISERDL